MLSYRSIRIPCIAVFSIVALATGGSAQTPQQPRDEALLKAQQQRDEAIKKTQKSADDINKFLAEQEGQQNGPPNAKQNGPPKGPYLLSGPPTFNTDFQARNPRVCAKVTTPPTPAQAAVLVQCAEESLTTGMSANLLLVTDLKVEMGRPHPFQMGINNASDVDTSSVVYPLRGQGTTWACSMARNQPPGQNCQRNQGVPKGIGECWHTQFGDWRCEMTTGGAGWENHLQGPTSY